jgi:hypothetical protein
MNNNMRMANNSLVMTAPARRSFSIISRHKGFVLCSNFVLPVKARVRPHKLGVSTISDRNIRFTADENDNAIILVERTRELFTWTRFSFSPD